MNVFLSNNYCQMKGVHFTSVLLPYFFAAANKRHIFDQYGEEGLKQGGGGGAGAGGGGGYMFTGDPHEIFSQFFGPGVNPFEFADFGGPMPNGGSFSFGSSMPTGAGPGLGLGGRGSGGFMDLSSMMGDPFGSRSSGAPRQDPPVEHTLNLNLEELYSGCTKKMKISRKVLSPDGRTMSEDKVVSVDVKPGWKRGTRVTFPQEGDQGMGKIPSDIVFVIEEKPHPQFTREGNNLRHKVNMTLRTALCGGEVVVPHINGTSAKRRLDKVVGPDTIDVISGQGMPISKQPGKRGDLLLSYNIKFPTSIGDKDREQMANILSKYQH